VKLSGEATLAAPVGRVYETLHDPAVLVRTIPGCRRLDLVGQDAYEMAVLAGVGAVKGTFAGSVRLVDAEPPHTFVLKAAGSGTPGTVATEVRVRLSENGGGTLLAYDAEADIGGPIAGVGQRLLASVAHKTAHEFFAAVNSLLTEDVHIEPAPDTAVPPNVVATSWSAPATAAEARLPAFLTGAAFGAAAALLGALVGGLVATRAARRR
jgi:uncharacterized protein